MLPPEGGLDAPGDGPGGDSIPSGPAAPKVLRQKTGVTVGRPNHRSFWPQGSSSR